ncbi:F-box/kelch-repeat protein At3g06240-like [Rutidosis leptorrhynchoides]|uniref:F-box/kelch-repeat protein At3g06240-like n=1 Tax=Rutidosis leptorrhynchoides TaxID=125765 RepID=UPI003A993FC5
MDVVELILARSDVEDVVRCKSVCKSWYNLISSNYFVKAHLKRSYDNNRQHGYLRILLKWGIIKLRNCMIVDSSNGLVINKLRNCMIVGSFNGLVCISDNEDELLLVTNPSTREVRKLPKPYIKYRGKVCCSGFGYDSLTNDYKVVAGFNISEHHMRFQVLSLKSNEWEFIGDNNNLTYNCSSDDLNCGFSYDGALHWFVYDTKKEKKVILSFDLSLEKFKEIPLPNDTDYVYDEIDRLGMFEEHLCIFRSYDIFAINRQIWVMKNYSCWELVPLDYEGNKYGAAINAYTLDRFPDNTWRLCNDYQGNVDMSCQSWFYISYPIFVRSLVSPYPCGKPKKNTNNKSEEVVLKWIIALMNGKADS